ESSAERVRLSEREARRREEESRRRAEEEERLVAARALLAAAESATEGEHIGEVEVLSEVDLIAFDEVALPEAMQAQPIAPMVEVEHDVATPPIEEKAPEPQPTFVAPTARAPQPTPPPVAQPTPPKPKEVIEEEWEDDEDDAPQSGGKSKVPMIFYTLNDRGEAESLDTTVERKKKSKKKKGKEREQDTKKVEERPWEKDRGKASHRARRPKGDEKSDW
ncbi:MAG: hypothetical protein H0T73_00200, partial [Ardenticatenales bacterium]|nr:hypothetical protein [Ardenticatenales bacterium]